MIPAPEHFRRGKVLLDGRSDRRLVVCDEDEVFCLVDFRKHLSDPSEEVVVCALVLPLVK